MPNDIMTNYHTHWVVRLKLLFIMLLTMGAPFNKIHASHCSPKKFHHFLVIFSEIHHEIPQFLFINQWLLTWFTDEMPWFTDEKPSSTDDSSWFDGEISQNFAGPSAPACRAPASAPLGTRFLGDDSPRRGAGSRGDTGGATKKWWIRMWFLWHLPSGKLT